MKIVSWNLGHQTREDPIPAALVTSVEALAPDMLVLNEFVDGPTRGPLIAALDRVGLSHVLPSKRVGRHNQVLIAARSMLVAGELSGPSMPGGAGESNFLHVKLPAARMEFVGLRAPAYETSAELKAYWEQLAALVRSTFKRPIVWIGDLNADPDTPSYIGGRHLAELERQGWQLPRPSGPWSFVKGTRIDHVLLSPSVPFVSAEYVTSIGGVDVASNDKATRVSDHAALMAVIAP